MHEMLKFLPMFAVSVCHAAHLGLKNAKMDEQMKILFGVNTPGGPWSDRRGSWSPHKEGKGEHFQILGPRHTSEMAEAKDLQFCVHVEGWGP